MCPDEVSPIALWVAIAAIIGYTYGEYTKSTYAEYIKNGSLGVVALALLFAVAGNCPAVLLQLAVPLLVAALLAKALFWALYRYVIK